MNKVLGILIVILSLLLTTRGVQAAAVVGNVAICDTCVTPGDFSAAGIAWYRSVNSGVYQVAIGNPTTGVIYNMTVGKQGGTVPNVAQQAKAYAAASKSTVITGNPTPNIIRASDLIEAQAAGGTITATGLSEDTASEDSFRTLIYAYKNNVLFNVSTNDMHTNSTAFGSFSGGQSEPLTICAKVWGAETAGNPKWPSLMESVAGAWNTAVKSYFGRGIMASIVFGNGDVATYQINPLDEDACVYVKGSAKNVNGQALADATPNIGGGDTGSVNMRPINSGGDASYSIGELWLVCSFQGGQLLGCYIQPD